MNLSREEYIEQTHLFRALAERLPDNQPLQDLLAHVRHELLVTTNLPMAVDFLLTELKHTGLMASAMARLPHYFAPFQTYLIDEAENERGRFDMKIAINVLRHEAEYRAQGATCQGLFLFQFETLCRNRLRYDRGLEAISRDPQFDTNWREWILVVRRQVGFIDFADLVYVRSEYYRIRHADPGGEIPLPEKPVLFGEKEGRIAWANRRKDPLFLFAALQRQLGYPEVPRVKIEQREQELIPQLARRVEQLEIKLRLLEEEVRGGIDITKFYGPAGKTPQALPPLP